MWINTYFDFNKLHFNSHFKSKMFAHCITDISVGYLKNKFHNESTSQDPPQPSDDTHCRLLRQMNFRLAQVFFLFFFLSVCVTPRLLATSFCQLRYSTSHSSSCFVITWDPCVAQPCWLSSQL